MQSVKSLESLPENPVPNIYDLLAKLDRILRLYRCAKKQGSPMLNEIRARVEAILENIKIAKPQKFKQIECHIYKLIEQSLAEPKSDAKAPSKALSSKTSQIGPQSSSFGQNHQQKSQNKILKRPSGTSGMQSSFNSMNSFSYSQKNVKIEQQIEFRLDKKQDSKQLSLSSSTGKNGKDLRSYCQTNMNILENKIEINEDVLNHLKAQSKDVATLLGVQKPQNMEKQKLFFCTIMEFGKQQIMSLNYKNEPYSAELEEFQNVIRCPLALCIIGTGINDIRAHYVKFLLEMTSPVPIIIVLNEENIDQSIVVKLKAKCIDSLAKAKSMEVQKIDSNFIKNKEFYKIVFFHEIPINKEKCVTTKILERKQRKKVYENKLAIMIENPKNSDNSKTNKMGMGIGIGGGINTISGGGMATLGGGGMVSGGIGIGLGGGNKGGSGLGGGGLGGNSIGGNSLGGGGIGLGTGIKSGISNQGMPKGFNMQNPSKAQETGFGMVKIQQKIEQPPPPMKIETPEPQPPKEQVNKQPEVEQKKQQIKQAPSPSFKGFNYKLHSRYLNAQIKQPYYVYLINEESEFHKRKGLKTLDQAIQFVQNNEGQRFCVEIIVKKDGMSLTPDILTKLFDCRQKVQIFSIKFKKLTVAKLFFFKFKEQASRADCQKNSLELKAFEGDTKLTKCIIVINQGNIVNYQSKNPHQEI